VVVLGGITISKTVMVSRHFENTAITMLATARVFGSGNSKSTCSSSMVNHKKSVWRQRDAASDPH